MNKLLLASGLFMLAVGASYADAPPSQCPVPHNEIGLATAFTGVSDAMEGRIFPDNIYVNGKKRVTIKRDQSKFCDPNGYTGRQSDNLYELIIWRDGEGTYEAMIGASWGRTLTGCTNNGDNNLHCSGIE